MREIVLEKKISDLYIDAIELICKKKNLKYETSDYPCKDKINIGSIDFYKNISEVNDFLSQYDFTGKWHFIYENENKGFYISGKDKINMLQALLKATDVLKYNGNISPVREYNVSSFDRFYENYDDFSFAFTKGADDFDIEKHMIDMVRIGVENFEINILYEDIPIQVREREDSKDMYPWWCSYMPTLDMFYETSVSKGVYPDKVLKENRNHMLYIVNLCRILGLKPMFTVFEPRVWPERLFKKYPETRGARVDRDAYSTVPEYAPDITHPIVIKHYRELIKQLMEDVPDLDIYEIWSQDSNAGFPWADFLYMKPNGPTRIYDKPFHEIVNCFLNTLQSAINENGGKARVHINIDWCYSIEEQEELINNLPKGVGLTFGYRLDENGNIYHIGSISKMKSEYVQALSENIANKWKIYGPLVGFPSPRETQRILNDLYNNKIKNLTMRGGVHTDVFVPYNINNEVVRAMKFNPFIDIDKFLYEKATEWCKTKEDADILYKVWQLCDKFNDCYMDTKTYIKYMHWTSAMFVSARTLYRKTVMPIVPDAKKLSFSETRYYKPYVFYCSEEDPSRYDMSFFNFRQIEPDEKLKYTYNEMENSLLPILKEAIELLENNKETNKIFSDLWERLCTFYSITYTEMTFIHVQLDIHNYKNVSDKQKIKLEIKELMLKEIKNTKEFIKILRNSENVLIPTTSGEETTYMYKTPLDNLLKRKIIAMENHLDDEPKAVEEL